MAAAFNLTAQLNLKGPSNIGSITSSIKKQLGTITANVDLKINANSIQKISQLNAGLQQLNKTLSATTVSATSAASAIKGLGQAFGAVNLSSLPQQISATSTALGQVKAQSNQATKSLAASTTQMEEFGKQSALAVRRFAAFSIVTSSIYALSNSINKGIEAFIEYDQQFVKLQQVTGQSADGLKSLSQEITSLSVGLGVSSAALTDVASTLAQAGLNAQDTEKALKALALSSLAPSFDSMNETVEGSIALMRQFGISAGGLEGALGSINTVAAKFAVEASDIITAVQRTGGVFATASKGVSEGTDALNEFIAVFTSIRATTRESAETIATGLRTIFTRIQRGSTIDALKEFGVNLQDTEGKFVGAYKAVDLLSKGLSSLDPRDVKFSKIIEELGGFRQIGKVIPLIQQFSVAQNALKTAQQGQGSLAKDAATAQLSLANQLQKVRQEFLALFREMGQSQGFQVMVKASLSLASALIKIVDAGKGLLPLLGVMLAFKGASAISQFASGFGQGLKPGAGKKNQEKPLFSQGGPVRAFATGGVVPGSGDGDTVPAMLTPGEFVIRKQAAKSIGTDNLHKMNKYGNGGKATLYDDIQIAEYKTKPGLLRAHDGDSIYLNVDPKPKLFNDPGNQSKRWGQGKLKYRTEDKPTKITSRLEGVDAYETRASREERETYGPEGGPAAEDNRKRGKLAKEITQEYINVGANKKKIEQAFIKKDAVSVDGRPMAELPELNKILLDKKVAKESSAAKRNIIPADKLANRLGWMKETFKLTDNAATQRIIQDYAFNYDEQGTRTGRKTDATGRDTKNDQDFQAHMIRTKGKVSEFNLGGKVQKFGKGGGAKIKSAESILLSALKQQQSADSENEYFKSSNNTVNNILDVSGVDKILAQIEKTYGVSSAKFLGSGGENAAFDIGDEVLKVSRTGLGIQTLAKDFGVKKKELDKMGNYQLPTGIDGVAGYRKVKTFGKLTAALQDKVVSRDTDKAMKDAQILQGKLAKEGKYWLDADGSNMGYDKKGKPTVIDGLIFDKSFVDKMGPDYREDIEVEGMMAEAAYDKSLKKRKPQKKSFGGMIQKFAEGGKAVRRVGIIDSDVLRQTENAGKVADGMKSIGADSITDYTIQLAKLAVQARKSDNLKKFRVIAGAAGSGKSSLATGLSAKDNATLRQTTRSHILTPEDIGNVDEVLAITANVSDKKLESYLRDADRTYTVSSSTKTEQDLIKRNKESRDITGQGLYGREPGRTSGVSTDFGAEEATLIDELGSKNVVLGRKKDAQGNLTNNFRRKKGDELPEIVQAAGFYTGGFAPPTRGHRGAFDQLLANIVAKNPNATLKDIVVSVAPNVAMVEGTEGLAHAARYGIFDADFRSLLADVNFKGAMISQDSQSTPGILPRVMEVPGENNRRKFARLKGAMAITSGKEKGVLGKYDRAGIEVTDIPRIEDISATTVRELLFNQDYAKLDKIVNPEVGAILKGNQPQLKNRSVMVPVLLEELNKAAEANTVLANQKADSILANAPGGPYRNISKKLKEEHPDIAAQVKLIRDQRDHFKSSISGVKAHTIISELTDAYPEIYGIDSSRRAATTASTISAEDARSHLGDRVKSLLPEGTEMSEPSLLESIKQNVIKQLAAPKGSGTLPTDSKTITSTFLNMPVPSDPAFGMFSGKAIDPGMVKKVWRQTYPGLSEDKTSSYIAVKEWLESQYNARTGAKTEELSQAIQESKKVGLVGMLPIGHEKLSGPFTWVLGKNASGDDVSVTASIIERGLGKKYEEEVKAAQQHAEQGSELLASGLSSKMKKAPLSLRSLDKNQLETLGQGNIEGAYIEQALARLWANLDNVSTRTRPIDYPDGLGESAELFPGISPTMPTEVKRTINSDSRSDAIKEFQRYFRLINGVPEPKEPKEAKTQKEVVKALAEGGEVQKFMTGGVATKTRKPKEPFGTGETAFPSRITKKYAEEQHSASESLRAKLSWDKNPKDERIMVDDQKVQEAYQQPFDREKFASSFKEKISRDSLFERMSDFAKFVGLPQEDLTAALPLQLDFGASKRGGGLGMFASAQFERGATGIRPYEGYDLSKFGYGEKQKQEAYGLNKLIAAKEKEIKKITKTPTRTFDDGSFSFDSEAYSKANDELRDLKNKSFSLSRLKSDAEKAAFAEQNATASAAGRGTISFASSMGYSSDTKNSTLYHEMTHQLFQGLRTKSADSFDKYRERVSSLFSGDNDDLADAFDALTAGGGYSSADVVYGRSYKSNNLSQILSGYYRQNLDFSRGAAQIPEDTTKNLASLSTQSTAAKRAREYRPINPKVNEALLQAGDKFGMTQEKINRMEDNGKEEFLTTLMENAPKLDAKLQPILDSTLTDLLGGAGIQRQKFAVGGKASRKVSFEAGVGASPFGSAVSKKLGSSVYDLEKGSGLSSFEFDEAKRFADSAGYNVEEFKEYLAKRVANKKQNANLRMNPASLLRAITPEKTSSTPKQLALAEMLKGEPDAGYRPILTEAQRLAASRGQTRSSALTDINNATRFAVGGVAESEQKKEKQYGKVSISEDSNTISVGYLKNDIRQGYATGYKMRDNLYYVGLSSATSGYGPRLYDILMEAATEKGAMLTSDRSMVSGDAKKVWEYYFNNRSDVKKTPLKPSDWTRNEALLDPKLYGKEETWPPATDPAWVLQSGYSKSPNLINGSDVVRPSSSAKPDYRSMMGSFFAARPKFANGGLVPGVGNQDTVPATLNVGDFVIRKKAVETIGASKLAGMSRYASGGSVDKVPALLTPGEFVFNRQSAQKIGYNKLHQLNHADKVAGYNKGGMVGGIQGYASGGSVTFNSVIEDLMGYIAKGIKAPSEANPPKLVTRPDTPSRATLQVSDQTVQTVKIISQELNNLGVSVSKVAELMKIGGDVSYKAMEKAIKKDIERMTITGASIEQIAKAETALAAVRAESSDRVKKTQTLENSFRNSKVGQKLGSGGAQQQIIAESAKAEKSIEKQKIKDISSTLQSMMPGATPQEIKQRATEVANTPEERAKTKERAYLSATQKVTGVKKSDFEAAGISGGDIQKYVNESLRDRKTLADMDKQLIASKMQELQNSQKYQASSNAEKSRMLAEVKDAATKEASIRREMINDLARSKGEKGVGAGGLKDYRNSPIYQTIKRNMPKSIGEGVGMATTAGAVVGGLANTYSDSIAKGLYNTSTDEGKLKAAKTGAAISSAGTIASTGLGVAAQSLAVDPTGASAAVIAVGTGLVVLADYLTDFTGSQEKATREVEKALRASEINAATASLDDAFKRFENDMSNIDLQEALNKALSNSVMAQTKDSSANINDAKRDYAYQNRSWGDLLSGKFKGSAQMDAKQLAEVNRAEAEKFAPMADKGYKQIQSEINSNASIEQIMSNDKLSGARRAITMSDPQSISEYTAKKAAEEKATGKPITEEASQAIIDEIASRKISTNEFILSSIKAKEVADALEMANLAGRKLAQSFQRLYDSIDQAINKNNFNIQQRKASTDYSTGALSGNATTPELNSKNINILDNPKTYSAKEFEGAVGTATQSLPAEDAKMIKGAATLQRNLAPAIEAELRKTLRTDAGLTADKAAEKAKEIGTAQIKERGLPKEMEETIINQLNASIDDKVKDDKVQNEFKNSPQAATDKFIESIRVASDTIIENAGKGGIDTLKKLLSSRQDIFNDFGKNLAKSSAFLKQHAESLVKAKNIIDDAKMNLREALTGVGETFAEAKTRFDSEISDLTGGTTDPKAISANIQNLQKKGEGLVKQRDNTNDDAAITKFTTEINKTNDAINNNKEALDRLASSSELAAKALGEVTKIKDLQKNRSELVNKLLTQTPEEAKKLNDTFVRLQNNLRGGLNTGANSRAAREAFSQALRSGSSLQGAYRAGNTVLAQQRQETLAMFQDPNIRGAQKLEMKNQAARQNKTLSDEQIEDIFNQQEAQLKTQMAIETGQINNPMVMADIEATKNRKFDPAMAQAADEYTKTTGRQADANTEIGRLALVQSSLLVSNSELKKALEGLTLEIKNARGFDAKVESGKVGAADAVAAGKGVSLPGASPAGGRAPVVRAARGGVIYANEGSLINFQPKGTDTVPAMLTPGEFVINARSTAEHLPLLQAINKSRGGSIKEFADGGVVYAQKGILVPQKPAVDTTTQMSSPRKSDKKQEPKDFASTVLGKNANAPQTIFGGSGKPEAALPLFWRSGGSNFPKPRNMAEVQMYKEGLSRGMTIQQIKNERQQAYRSRSSSRRNIGQLDQSASTEFVIFGDQPTKRRRQATTSLFGGSEPAPKPVADKESTKEDNPNRRALPPNNPVLNPIFPGVVKEEVKQLSAPQPTKKEEAKQVPISAPQPTKPTPVSPTIPTWEMSPYQSTAPSLTDDESNRNIALAIAKRQQREQTQRNDLLAAGVDVKSDTTKQLIESGVSTKQIIEMNAAKNIGDQADVVGGLRNQVAALKSRETSGFFGIGGTNNSTKIKELEKQIAVENLRLEAVKEGPRKMTSKEKAVTAKNRAEIAMVRATGKDTRTFSEKYLGLNAKAGVQTAGEQIAGAGAAVELGVNSALDAMGRPANDRMRPDANRVSVNRILAKDKDTRPFSEKYLGLNFEAGVQTAKEQIAALGSAESGINQAIEQSLGIKPTDRLGRPLSKAAISAREKDAKTFNKGMENAPGLKTMAKVGMGALEVAGAAGESGVGVIRAGVGGTGFLIGKVTGLESLADESGKEIERGIANTQNAGATIGQNLIDSFLGTNIYGDARKKATSRIVEITQKRNDAAGAYGGNAGRYLQTGADLTTELAGGTATDLGMGKLPKLAAAAQARVGTGTKAVTEGAGKVRKYVGDAAAAPGKRAAARVREISGPSQRTVDALIAKGYSPGDAAELVTDNRAYALDEIQYRNLRRKAGGKLFGRETATQERAASIARDKAEKAAAARTEKIARQTENADFDPTLMDDTGIDDAGVEAYMTDRVKSASTARRAVSADVTKRVAARKQVLAERLGAYASSPEAAEALKKSGVFDIGSVEVVDSLKVRNIGGNSNVRSAGASYTPNIDTMQIKMNRINSKSFDASIDHELGHGMQNKTIGGLSPAKGKGGTLVYEEKLMESLGPDIDRFLSSPDGYQALLDSLSKQRDIGSLYNVDRIKKEPVELFTSLIQASHSNDFTKNPQAVNMLKELMKFHGFANGGIVYAANGALMQARPSSTDTVPAMLTPGEFVVNRSSAQEHMPLLQAINNRNYESGGLVKYMAQGGVVTPQYRDVGGAIGSLASSSIMGAGLDMGAISELAKELPRLKEAFGSFEKLSEFTQSFEKLTQNMGSNLTGFAETVANMPSKMEHSMKAVVNGTINSNIPGATTQIVNSRHEAQIVYDQNTQRLDRASEGAFSRSDPTIMRGTSGAGGTRSNA